MKLSVVIPVYNEEAILSDAADTLCAALDALCESGAVDACELIFSNDGSKDRTQNCIDAVIRRAPGRFCEVRSCGYAVNAGKGCAVRHGVLASSGDLVVYTDCDLAYGTAVIGEAVRRMKETGADLLIGSRALHPDGYAGYTRLRKAASVIYLRVLAAYAGFSLSDSQCGFKAMKGDIGRKLFADCKTDGFAFDFELILRAQKAGASVTELPVKIVNHRDSKVHIIRDSLRMLRDIREIKKDLKKA